MSLASRFFQWLMHEDPASERRSQPRLFVPPLRAYPGVFGSAQSFPVGNISSTGVYLVTAERWEPGACMPLRLERTDLSGFAELGRFVVSTQVVRRDRHGIAFTFLSTDPPTDSKNSPAVTDYGWQGARWATHQVLDEMIADFRSAQSNGKKPY